jgi:hypothetical protein
MKRKSFNLKNNLKDLQYIQSKNVKSSKNYFKGI